MDKIASFISSLFEGLDLRRKWLITATLITLVILGILVFEYYTGHFYYVCLEKKIRLLRELQLTFQEGVASNPELYPVYLSTVRELASREVHPLTLPNINDPVMLWKGISGASIFILLTIAGVFGAFGKENKVAAGIVLGVLSALLGYLGTLVPIIYKPWVNYIGFPVLQFGGLLLLGNLNKKRKN